MFLLTFVVLTFAVTTAPVSIPLESIWAVDMPGTQDIRKLEPQHYGKEVRKLNELKQIELQASSKIRQISKTLHRNFEKKPAGPGFVVEGSEKQALQQVHQLITEQKKPSSKLSSQTPLTLFFFAREAGQYVHLKHCERSDSTITIKYQFVPHKTKQLTRHCALIPIGALPTGKYSVRFENVEYGTKFLGREFVPISKKEREQLVCQSFDFSVLGNPD